MTERATAPRRLAATRARWPSDPAAHGGAYTADSIQVLEGLDAVRRRPGMYIGSTDARGLHHLVWEVVDNSIDEAMAGHATQHRGDASWRTARSATRTTVAACPWAARSRPARTPSRSSTPSCTRAASSAAAATRSPAACTAWVSASSTRSRSRLTVESVRDGKVWTQSYERGKPTGAVSADRPAPATGRGTTTTFRPDPQVFDTVEFSFDVIAQRLRESAYLTKGVFIRLVDERVSPAREKSFHFEGGLVSFVRHLNKGKDVLNVRPIAVERRDGPTQIEVAIQYNDSFSETVLAFANNINTVDGGHARHRLPRGAHHVAQRLGAPPGRHQGLQVEPLRRRRPRGPDRRRQRQAHGAAVRGPDEGQARQRRGQGPGPDGGRGGHQPVPRREPRRRAAASSTSR